MNKTDQTPAQPLAIVLVAGERPRQLLALVQRPVDEAEWPGYTAFADLPAQVIATAELNKLIARQLADLLGENGVPGLNADDIRSFRIVSAGDQETLEITLKQPNDLAALNWQTANQWLSQYSAGKLLINPRHLQLLRDHAGESGSATADAGALPVTEYLAGLRVIAVPSHTLPPADTTNCFVIGDMPKAGEYDYGRIVVDPSPASKAELERLINALAPLQPSAILITHHHGDHNERADELARRLNLPVMMSEYTATRLRTAKPGFFEQITLKICADGDELCRWQSLPVVAIAVPGHDEGQLALAPAGSAPAWCIVGDLIQGIGTVVIAPPEGNMRRYFTTLQKMIELNPAVIAPSHGVPMGSTFRLRATLEHRQQRENDILTRRQRGESEDAMLAGIYPDLPEALLPLARINIQSHAEKLREEGRW